MSNKRYFWLKLNEDFFDEDTIAFIEEQENGKDYVIFYLKLLLKSIRDEGKMARFIGNKVIPYDVKSLAKLTNTSIDTVAVAMKLFSDYGLVEQLDTGELYLTQIDEMIGTETAVAQRVRKHRALKNVPLLQSNTNETKSNTEIDIELDIELELEKEKTIVEKKELDDIPYKEIIDYLNKILGSRYKNTNNNQTVIRARWNDGFRLEDFKKVIDIKNAEWSTDKDMAKYLRPITLFGTKFESYLNQPTTKKELSIEERNKLRYGES